MCVYRRKPHLWYPARSLLVPRPKSSLVHWRLPAMSATAQSSLTAASPSATSTERGWARNLCCGDTEAAATVTITTTGNIILIVRYLDHWTL